MSKPPPLPDLEDDAEFRQRLSPLVSTVLPGNRQSGGPSTVKPADREEVVKDIRLTGIPDKLNTRLPVDRNAGLPKVIEPDNRNSGLVLAAEAQARIEEKRGVKKRFEYLIPERVGKALAEDAAARGISATTRLLEVLRDAGYPVIREDLIDLRKMPKR